jgi:hypothetical protein
MAQHAGHRRRPAGEQVGIRLFGQPAFGERGGRAAWGVIGRVGEGVVAHHAQRQRGDVRRHQMHPRDAVCPRVARGERGQGGIALDAERRQARHPRRQA